MKMDIILCSYADDDLKNYTNVFNEIDVKKKDEKIDFTIVCKINMENDSDSEMNLHFFIFNETDGKKKGLYLMEGKYTRENEDTLDDFKVEFSQIPLSGAGIYAIEVVRNDDCQETTQNDGPKVYREGKVVGRIPFSVNII